MSEQKADAEPSAGTQNCPPGKKWDADLNKCVEAGGTKPPAKADAVDDPYIKQVLIDSITALGWTIPKDNCDSIASLKQLHTFAKANPKTDSAPPKEKDKKETVTDSIPEAPAADQPELSFEQRLDSAMKNYYNFREDTLLFIKQEDVN